MIAHFRPIFFAFLGLMFGLWLMKLYYYNSPYFLYAVLAVFVIVFIFILLWFANKDNKFFQFFHSIRYKYLAIALFTLLGSGLYLISTAVYTLDFHPDENVTYGVVGTIDTNYIQTEKGTYFFISNVSVLNESDVIDLKRNMYVYISHAEKGAPGEEQLSLILPGNIILFSAEIVEAPVFDADEINYFAFRNNFEHAAYIEIGDILVTGGQMGFLDSVREYIREMYHNYMDDRYAGLAFSVLVGDRTELPRDISDNFSISGIAHVVAVSGLNTAFIMMLLLWLLKKLKANRWVKLITVIVVLVFYALLCDMTPSVVRASLMSIFLLVGTLFGKQADKLNSISLAGIVTLLFSPVSLFDLSFLLSYTGVFGIFLLYPVMQRAFRFLKWRKLIDATALTVSATIGTAPLVINAFGYFSLIGFVANLVLVPLFGYAFMILFVVTLCALIIPYIAGTLYVFQYGFWLVDKGAMLCASVPFASATVPKTNEFALACYYLGTFAASRYNLVSQKTKVISVVLCFSVYFVCLIIGYFLLYNSILI